MKKTELFIAIVIAIIIMASGAGYALRRQYEKEIKDLRFQLAHTPVFVHLERDTIRDTVEVVTAPVITAELKALRRQHVIDGQLIRDLQLKVKQLDAVQTTSIETKDTARAAYSHKSNLFSYEDEWSHLEFDPNDSTFYYNIRDSLATVVYHEYKHRFLWWRWGVKGYKVKIVNFNPHAHVTYNRYIKAASK